MKEYCFIRFILIGDDNFRFFSKLYLKGTKICFIICDNESSIKSTVFWKKSIEESLEQNFNQKEKISFILIQNKNDLIINQKENYKLMEDFSKKNNFNAFFQTSTVNSSNLNELLDFSIELALKNENKSSIYSEKYSKESKINGLKSTASVILKKKKLEKVLLI